MSFLLSEGLAVLKILCTVVACFDIMLQWYLLAEKLSGSGFAPFEYL